MTTWREPSIRDVVVIALWVRSGCTADVARVLAGVSFAAWEAWISRGREDRLEGRHSICTELLDKLELADAMRRAEVMRSLHHYVMRNPERGLEYLARRWPDALADVAALPPAPAASAGGSLVDQILDVVAAQSSATGAAGPAPIDVTARSQDGGVVGDEPQDAPDRKTAPA